MFSRRSFFHGVLTFFAGLFLPKSLTPKPLVDPVYMAKVYEYGPSYIVDWDEVEAVGEAVRRVGWGSVTGPEYIGNHRVTTCRACQMAWGIEPDGTEMVPDIIGPLPLAEEGPLLWVKVRDESTGLMILDTSIYRPEQPLRGQDHESMLYYTLFNYQGLDYDVDFKCHW